jgi:cell division protein FtsQ
MRFLSRARQSGTQMRTAPLRRRRRRQALAALALLGLAGLGGGVWLVRGGILAALAEAAGERLALAGKSLGLAVDSVAVEGRARVSRETVLKAIGVERGTPILAVDLAQAKARLEALPWVRSASVERRLPQTIFVRLTERQPLAFWQRQGKLVLVDRDGKTITDENLDSFGALIVLVGDDAPAKGAALLDMLATEPALARHVAAAVRVGGRRWNLKLDNGVIVALPETDAEAAWHHLAALERDKALLQRDILMVDLRLPDRLVVRLPPEPKAKEPAKKGRQPGKAT